jgi:hypothetical protein
MDVFEATSLEKVKMLENDLSSKPIGMPMKVPRRTSTVTMGTFRRDTPVSNVGGNRNSSWLTLGLVVVAFLSKTVGAQNSTTICQGVRDALYTTDWEREHNPCNDTACTYDATSGRLTAECRYDYCEACDANLGFCGVRVVQINQTLTEVAIAAYVEQQAKLDIGSTKKYCIDYSDGGAFASKFICIDIDDSFNTNCDKQYQDLPYGLPLLTCDETNGCQCAVPNGKSDTKSPFIGFEKLKFDSCYVKGATAGTTSSQRGHSLATRSMLISAAFFVLML